MFSKVRNKENQYILLYRNKFSMAERIRTNAEIDILNQFLEKGETPLPYEIAENNNTPENIIAQTEEVPPVIVELTEDQKLAQAKIESDKIAAEKLIAEKQSEIDTSNEIAKNKIIASNEEKEKVVAPIEFELDDEKILAYLKNKKGKEITSLDELINPAQPLTEDQKKEATEKREARKFAFGLETGLFSKKQLEEFITDTKNPSELVFAAYKADQVSKDPNISDEEIMTEFNDRFGLEIEDKESRQYITGQNLLNKIASGLIKEKHSKILNLDNDYSAHESNQSKQSEIDNKVQRNTPLYNSDLQKVKSDIKKVSIQLEGNETFDTELDDAVINEITSEMQSSNYSKRLIEEGWNIDNMKQVAQTSAIIKSLPQILKKYADAQVLKNQAGVKGIIPNGKQGARERAEVVLTEDQKKALAYFDEKASLAN